MPVDSTQAPTRRYTPGTTRGLRRAALGLVSRRGRPTVVLIRHDLRPLLRREVAASDDARLPPPGRGVDLPADRGPIVGDGEQAVAVGGEARRHPGVAHRGSGRASRWAGATRRPRAPPRRRRARWPACRHPVRTPARARLGGKRPASASRRSPRGSRYRRHGRRQAGAHRGRTRPSFIAGSSSLWWEGWRAARRRGSRTSTPDSSLVRDREP